MIRERLVWSTRFTVVACIVAVGLSVTPSVLAQEDRNFSAKEFRKQYFELFNLKKTKNKLERYISREIEESFDQLPKNPSRAKRKRIRNERFVSSWARKMARNGVTKSDLKSLKEDGFDLAKGINPPSPEDTKGNISRHILQAHALANDLVIIGTIKSVELTPPGSEAYASDGFGSTFRVRVDEALRGAAPSGSIITVRQETGRVQARFHDQQIMEVRDDPSVLPGRQYLFWLSNGKYKFQKMLHFSTKKDNKKLKQMVRKKNIEEYYALNMARQFKDGRLKGLSEAQSSKYSSRAAKSTEQMISYIREVGTTLKGAGKQR